MDQKLAGHDGELIAGISQVLDVLYLVFAVPCEVLVVLRGVVFLFDHHVRLVPCALEASDGFNPCVWLRRPVIPCPAVRCAVATLIVRSLEHVALAVPQAFDQLVK